MRRVRDGPIMLPVRTPTAIGTAAAQSTGQNRMNTTQQVTSAMPRNMFLRALDRTSVKNPIPDTSTARR